MVGGSMCGSTRASSVPRAGSPPTAQHSIVATNRDRPMTDFHTMLRVQVVGQRAHTVFYTRRLLLSVLLEGGDECDEITTSCSQRERSER
jgi:hypothetical protein